MKKMTENNLLNHLLRTGITPSFSFPLDVAEFRGEGQVNFRRKVWPKMGTDLKQALSVYSPGKVLTVDGEDYQVHGLYIYGAEDGVNRARTHFSDDAKEDHISYYNRCTARRCGWVSKVMNRPDQHDRCPVCAEESVETGIWYRPDGFAPLIVPWEGETQHLDRGYNRTMKPAKPDRNSESEPSGKVEFPAPLTDGTESEIKNYQLSDVTGNLSEEDRETLADIFDRVNIKSTHDDGKGVELLLINSGYNGQGYYICKECGYIAKQANDRGFTAADGGHHRPYVADPGLFKPHTQESKNKCKGVSFVLEDFNTLFLGMTFRTDMLMISLDGEPPFLQETSLANQRAFNNALTTLKEALISEIQKSAKLVNREINGGVRKRSKLNSEGDRINAFEIFLYDDVSGGAGLSSSILTNENSWSKFLDVLRNTERRLSGEMCLDGIGCSKACLGCLFDFRNTKEHSRFDRRNGLRLIRYILHGMTPTIESGSRDNDSADLEELSKLLKENLKLIGSQVTVDTQNGCIVVKKDDMVINIRPRISFVDIFEDPVVKEWDEDDIEFEETISDVDISSPAYVQITYQQIKEKCSSIAEEISRIMNPNRLF